MKDIYEIPETIGKTEGTKRENTFTNPDLKKY